MGERKSHGVRWWTVAVGAAFVAIAVLGLVDSRRSSGGAEPPEAQTRTVAAEPLLEPARDESVGRSASGIEESALEASATDPVSTTTALPLSHTLIVVDEAGARVTADVTVLGFDFEERFSVDARADPVAVEWERLPVRIEARTAHASGELALLAMPPDPVIAVTVRPFAELAGVVVDPAGELVGPGVRVAVYDRRYATVKPLGEGWTGIDGRFVVRGLPADVSMVAHVGGGGFVGDIRGHPVVLDGRDARYVVQYLFGIAIDGSAYERGLEGCSVNQGLVHSGTGAAFRQQVVARHPGLRHLSALSTFVESKPYSRVLLVAGDRADPPPSLRVGAQWSGRKGKMHEVALQRVFDEVATFRLEAAIEVEEAAPRDASVALLFSVPPAMERLTSNEYVGQVVFHYEDGEVESYALMRDDLLRGMAVTCMPSGEARVEVSLEPGVGPARSVLPTWPAVSLSRDRATVFVDLSHLTTLEVEPFDAHAGPVRGKLNVFMRRSDVPSNSRGLVDWTVQRDFTEPPYLVFGLAPGEYFIDGRSPQASPDRPASVQIPHGGGLVKAVLDLSRGAK